ncbi:hypothetical protein Ciccas_009108 [Cichlidogyrus casuarinus]|uniref:CIP2A N-terminal domain-containing protein n=1 Tax=Cichlidogyrus casuarinus TaxID=1844966 RepID=A0ABD2PY78_9PLAT
MRNPNKLLLSCIQKYTSALGSVFDDLPQGVYDIFRICVDLLSKGESAEPAIAILYNVCRLPMFNTLKDLKSGFDKLRSMIVHIIEKENSSTFLIVHALGIKYAIWPSCESYFSDLSAHKTFQLLFNLLINDEDEAKAHCALDLICELTKDQKILARLNQYPKILDCVRETVSLIHTSCFSLIPKVTYLLEALLFGGSDEIGETIRDALGNLLVETHKPEPQLKSRGRGRKTRAASSLAPSTFKSPISQLLSTKEFHFEISALIIFFSKLVPSLVSSTLKTEQTALALLKLVNEALGNCCEKAASEYHYGMEYLLRVQVTAHFATVVTNSITSVFIEGVRSKKDSAQAVTTHKELGSALIAMLPHLDLVLQQELSRNHFIHMLHQCVDEAPSRTSFGQSILPIEAGYDDSRLCYLSCAICVDLGYIMKLCVDFWSAINAHELGFNFSADFNLSAPSVIKRNPQQMETMDTDDNPVKPEDEQVQQQRLICEQALNAFLTRKQTCPLFAQLLVASTNYVSLVEADCTASLERGFKLLHIALGLSDFDLRQ